MCPPLNIFGLGGIRVPILFGNDLLWNDLPYSKGYMKFGCLEPSKIMFDFWNIFLVERRVTQFVISCEKHFRPTKYFKSPTLYSRVLGTQTSRILLNMVNHSTASPFQNDLEPKPHQTPRYLGAAQYFPPPPHTCKKRVMLRRRLLWPKKMRKKCVNQDKM